MRRPKSKFSRRRVDETLADSFQREANAERNVTDELPSALTRFDELADKLFGKQPAVFLDYDGTLTPIVERPEQAKITVEMRQVIRKLAARCPVAIISGRDRRNVADLVGIRGIHYAGSHGFDISGPAGTKLQLEQGTKYLPILDRAEKDLHQHLDQIEGAQIERKKFAIAVHYRRVAENLWPRVNETVDSVLADCKGLRKTGGKRIFELRPELDWDKGKAVAWLLEELDLNRTDVVPVFIGDDLTDEDALREIKSRGLGILVRDESRPTLAGYALENTDEVRQFLQTLCTHLENRNGA